MKLKEKLAEEHVRSTGMVIDSLELADYLEAKEYFLAGFEKAREMVEKIAHNYAHKDICKYNECESWLEPCNTVHEIKVLGEEEVE